MVKCEMNKTQKIIKTFFLTLFVTIVCMCSTVFAASEPIGSIKYPIGLKTEYPFNFESIYKIYLKKYKSIFLNFAFLPILVYNQYTI